VISHAERLSSNETKMALRSVRIAGLLGPVIHRNGVPPGWVYSNLTLPERGLLSIPMPERGLLSIPMLVWTASDGTAVPE